MNLGENLAAIHAYLCADGYVLKTENKKQKQYGIGFRNTNLTLLKDFQKRFNELFGIEPHLDIGERCRIGNKEIHQELIKNFGSFHSWEWKMPKMNKKLTKIWLRAYFDCEGWVFCKTHQNRHIGVDCVNELGLSQVEKALNKLKIKVVKKYNPKRKIHRIIIYGEENLKIFSENIGFLHPDKSEKLKETLKDFVVYNWLFPKNEKECKIFILNKLKEKIRIKKPYCVRIISKEKDNLTKLKYLLNKLFGINSLLNKYVNGIGTQYYELSINKKSEVRKLVDLEVIPNIFKST